MKNLLAKWLDRKGPKANKIRKYMGLTPKEYRKTIVNLSNTVEQLMCSKDFDNINYEHVPSLAMNKYRNAFYKKDQTRFSDYIDNVKSGTAKMCAGAIYPYQLYDAFQKAKKEVDFKTIEAQWYSLPDYMEGSDERVLPMVDTSASMTWYGGLPARAGWSLGLYISERNKSIFKDAFVTFHTEPEMVYLRGTISERMRAIKGLRWKGTTNLESAFQLILSKAIENNVPENEMPTVLVILSDLQFDPSRACYNATAFEIIKEYYKAAGYKMPRVVFWNLRAEKDNVTASAFDESVSLVSGFSPTALKSFLSVQKVDNESLKQITPYETMMNTINDDRYSKITI